MHNEKSEDLGIKSLKGIFSYSLRSVATYAIAIFATGILSAYLDPQEFGIYYIVLSVIGIFTFFSDIGLAASLIQKKEEPTLPELRTVFSVQFLLALMILLITIVFKNFIVKNVGIVGDGYLLLLALAFSFVLASLKTIPSVLLERELKFEKLVIPQVVEQIVFYTIAVMGAIYGLGINSFTVAVLLRSVAGLIVIYTLKSWRINFHISVVDIKKLLPYGFKFQINDLLARIKDDLFIVLLAKFLSPYALGILGWAKRWSMFPYQFAVSSVVSVTFPTMARIQNQNEKIQLAMNKSWLYLSSLIFPILLLLCLGADGLVRILPQYTKWQEAIVPLYLFCVNIALATISNPAITLLNATGNINKTLKIMIAMTLASYVAAIPAYLTLGQNGIALTAVVSAAFGLIAVKIVNTKYHTNFIDQIMPSSVATLVTIGVINLVFSTNTINFLLLILKLLMALGVYLLVFGVMMRGRLMSEWRWLKLKLFRA